MSPRLAMILISIPLILFFGLFLLVKYLEHTSVFFPGKIVQLTPQQLGLAYEDLYLNTSDGVKINAWLVKASNQAATVIFAHGNAGTIGERTMRVKFWHDLGLNILIFDYRGYGNSSGKPTEKGIYLDAQAAYDYLQGRPDIDHNRIIAYGASLGGAVMIDLAVHRKLAALIVESSLTSAVEMAKRLYSFIPSFMISIKFDSISKVRDISIPKLFLHSQEDHTVPFSMGQKLYEAAVNPKEFLVIYGGHNDGSSIHDSRVLAGLLKFLKEYSLL